MLCYVQLHALCSVTCYFTYVALCYVAYIMLHMQFYVTYALYKMHYVTRFATNITLCCITGADSFMLLHICVLIHYVTYIT